MSHEDFNIKTGNYSFKALPGFTNALDLKKGQKFLMTIHDEEGTFDKMVIISKVNTIINNKVIQLEFENYAMYEPFELSYRDYILLEK